MKGDYVIAYFHTLTSNSNYPSFSWLKDVYNVLPYKYKKNLKAFYIIHPTFWTKVNDYIDIYSLHETSLTCLTEKN